MAALGVLAMLVALALGSGQPVSEAAGGYRGRVIDTETRRPIAGAAVVAYWDVTLLAPGHPQRFLDAEEAVTGADGEFVIGKQPRRSSIPLSRVGGPYLTIFSPGYGAYPAVMRAPLPPREPYSEVLERMQRDVVVFELPRLQTREQRLVVFRTVQPVIVPEAKIPNFMRLLDIERRQLNLEP
jgi:hypothetical protein